MNLLSCLDSIQRIRKNVENRDCPAQKEVEGGQ